MVESSITIHSYGKNKDKDGHFIEVKALLDNGSQANFVSASLAKN